MRNRLACAAGFGIGLILFGLCFLATRELTQQAYAQTNVSNALGLSSVTFANLGTPPNGAMYYCSDCTQAVPCAGSGTGAVATRIASAWSCTAGGAAGGGGSLRKVWLRADFVNPSGPTNTGAFEGAVSYNGIASSVSSGAIATGLVSAAAGGQFCGLMTYRLPSTWDGAAPTVNFVVIPSDTNVGTVSISAATLGGGATVNLNTASFNAYSAGVTGTTSGTAWSDTIIGPITLNTTGLAAGQILQIAVKRNAGDTYPSTAWILGAELTLTY